MFALLPQDHVLKEVVRLESTHWGRIRYLAVVACAGNQPDEEEEACGNIMIQTWLLVVA